MNIKRHIKTRVVKRYVISSFLIIIKAHKLNQSSFSILYHSHSVSFILVPINRYTPGVQRTDGDLWQEDSSVEVSWDSASIGGLDDDVSIDLARYKMDDDDVPVLDSFHTVVDSQSNNGHSQFVVTKGQGDG